MARKGKPQALLLSDLSAPPRQVADALSRHIRKEESGCWTWTGVFNTGSAILSLNGQQYKAARVAFLLESSTPLLSGVMLKRVCDNELCVSPKHRVAMTRGAACKAATLGKR